MSRTVNDGGQETCPGRRYGNMAFGQLKLNVPVTDVWESSLAKFHASQLEADIIIWDWESLQKLPIQTKF